jgi:hypothetical protein
VVTNVGQIVAALAGGAIVAIAAMLAVRLWVIERQNEERRRIDTAVQAIVSGVEAFRRSGPPEEGPPAQPPDAAAEVHTKAHLRLVHGARPVRVSGRRQRPAEGSRSASVRRR